ncbi:MAG: HK97 gp10 family phage protein [Caulobacteraceae bacterium]|nr:HK97 gp10 family phage protein [Caulobacteraceae bacterium]
MTLKLMGVEKVIAAIKDVNSELNAKIDAEIDAQAQSIATRAKRKAPANFSELRNSIGTEKVSNLKYTVFANAYHAPYIEFGTVKKVSVPPELNEVAAAVKGRASRGNFASMIEAIYVWGTKKKIIKKGDKNHAVNIARKIMINGIAPQPFLWPSFLEVRPKLISRLQTILKSANL